MLNTFTVSFFGHRDFNAHMLCEDRLEQMIRKLIDENEYVEFLVGRNGEFDIFVTSVIHRVKHQLGGENCSLIWVLPYVTADFNKNIEDYENYYDEIEICEKASNAHFKSAVKIRNCEMVDRCDLVICYIERNIGGAYNAMKYAVSQEKKIVNLCCD